MNLDKLLTIDYWSGGWAFFIFLALQCTFVAVVGIFFSAKSIQKTVEEGTRDIRGQLAEVRGQLLSLKDILRYQPPSVDATPDVSGSDPDESDPEDKG